MVALITASVTIAGWLVNSFLNRKREDRKRRLEQRISRYQDQLQEFYCPLFNLLHQIIVYNGVELDILAHEKNVDVRVKIEDYFDQSHLVDLHGQVNNVLKTKFHLALESDGGKTAASLIEYMEYSYQERAQKDLWVQKRIDTTYLPAKSWPDGLLDSIREDRKTIMGRLSAALEERQKEPSAVELAFGR